VKLYTQAVRLAEDAMMFSGYGTQVCFRGHDDGSVILVPGAREVECPALGVTVWCRDRARQQLGPFRIVAIRPVKPFGFEIHLTPTDGTPFRLARYDHKTRQWFRVRAGKREDFTWIEIGKFYAVIQEAK